MPDAGAVTLGDCHRQGRIMIEIGCVKCPRYGGHRLDRLIALCGPYYSLEQLAAFMSWDCAKRRLPKMRAAWPAQHCPADRRARAR